jgi:vacuolar-type H+-ATPase subunit E/Vma4
MAKTLGDITGELTKKVLEPAKAEAERIRQDAQVQADQIIAAAQKEAQIILEQSKREIESLKRQMDVDLETAGRNFVIMIEERLENAVVDPVVEEAIKPILEDRAFLEKLILDILAAYAKQTGKEHHIEILLPADQKDELESWFMDKFRNKMANPLDVRFTDKISFGFKIGIAGRGSHINFSEGLVEVFSDFVSPRFRKYFFTRKES